VPCAVAASPLGVKYDGPHGWSTARALYLSGFKRSLYCCWRRSARSMECALQGSQC